MAFVFSAFLSSCAAPPPAIESRTIAKVEIPIAPKAPDLAPVSESMRKLDSAVSNAREEMVRAGDTLKDSKRMSEQLKKIVDTSFEEADEVAQVALKSIREAAAAASSRLEEVSAMLSAAGDKLAAAEEEAETLGLEVETLNLDLSLQSSHVEQLRHTATVANARVDEANAQKDEFQNALTTATSQVGTFETEVARLKGQRFKLALTSIILLLIVGGLSYVILKI